MPCLTLHFTNVPFHDNLINIYIYTTHKQFICLAGQAGQLHLHSANIVSNVIFLVFTISMIAYDNHMAINMELLNFFPSYFSLVKIMRSYSEVKSRSKGFSQLYLIYLAHRLKRKEQKSFFSTKSPFHDAISGNILSSQRSLFATILN